ncbi:MULTISPECIES: GNAT family N-acetyltransferase [Kitasatospora]|uniref:Putative acetyltransferase n=1 Tax=Kitasatospora setae (strain ATCC 33774 / DSM 43861 / JCM 3304 / KCC A-0304 / NBRC 14216 / KM-6054) TaxID=452652 RepID=E4N6U8_KITSK|nr:MULTISPECIES: GNAT family N-acetyltransferase [Kitasatospora]BAJ26929.1 putative acetyltransferase [Kitasatospora setae KM-6054]
MTAAEPTPAPADLAATAPVAQPVVRAAELRDVPAVVALVESAYRGDSSRAGWTTEADLLEGQRTDEAAVTELLTRPDSVVLLVERDGAPIACCHVERRGGAAYFGMFSVSPAIQGGGLGRLLLARAEEWARTAWGATAMEMTVIEQRAELIAWYERRGFARTGEFEPFPYGDLRFGVPLRTDLRFAKLAKSLV